MRALPYSMRRVKVLALAAGERDFANRMRMWFGGVSVKERQAIMGRETSLTPPDPYPFSSKLSSLRQTCSSIRPPGFRTICLSVVTA